MPRKSLMQDVIIYTYYLDYTMNLTSKGLTVASSTGLVLLNKEKKYLMLLMLDLCLRHLLFSEFSEIN